MSYLSGVLISHHNFVCIICSTALDLHLGLGILRLQEGLDLKENANVEQNGKATTGSTESLMHRNMSYSQMSHGKYIRN